MPRRPHPNHRPAATLPVELRRTSVPAAVREWVRRSVGAEVVRAVRLQGASSVAIHRLELTDGCRLVVRRYVWTHFIEEEPEAPGREVDALGVALGHGLCVPEVVAVDLTGAEVGDGVPVVLMTHVPGRPLADPDPMRLAATAAAIHDVEGRVLGHDYYRWFDDDVDMAKPPPLSTRPELWERAIDLWRDAMPTFAPVLIHRDFHPGNVLWRRREMTGIVDWASACTGPAGCDVATCRANLVGWAGPNAAEAFVAAYESITGSALHPYWQMANLLESDPADWTSEHLTAHEPTLARLVSRLT